MTSFAPGAAHATHQNGVIQSPVDSQQHQPFPQPSQPLPQQLPQQITPPSVAVNPTAPQSQSQSQSNAGQSQPQDGDIAPERLQAFQTALGQLIDGPLFANDAADVEPLVAAVNARIVSASNRELPFEKDEAEAALRVLSERNKIMWSEGVVYKI